MATQRIAIAKIHGEAADVIVRRLKKWSAARITTDPAEWSPDQWPLDVRSDADRFIERLRAKAVRPPVMYYAEWLDLWSMGDLFDWLTPERELRLVIYGDRFEVFGYMLPDDGQLESRLRRRNPQQFVEYEWFILRLLEAIQAWAILPESSVLIVAREVVGGLVADEEMANSLAFVPAWIAELE